KPEAHPPVPDEDQVEEGQHLDDAARVQPEEVEDPELADLVRGHDQGRDQETAMEKPPPGPHGVLHLPHGDQATAATTSAQRWQRAGWSSVPTYGSSCKQRGHFSASARAASTRRPTTTSSRKGASGAAPTPISAS